MTPYLPTLTRLVFLEGEAGNRAQSDSRYGLTLALIGSFYDETDSRKATHIGEGRKPEKPYLARD